MKNLPDKYGFVRCWWVYCTPVLGFIPCPYWFYKIWPFWKNEGHRRVK